MLERHRLGKRRRPYGNYCLQRKRETSSCMEVSQDFRPSDGSSWSAHILLKADCFWHRKTSFRKSRSRPSQFKMIPSSPISAGQGLHVWSTGGFSITKSDPSILPGKSQPLKTKLNQCANYPDYNTFLKMSGAKSFISDTMVTDHIYFWGCNLYLSSKG